MSASVGIVASFSRAVLASPECAWHHRNTAFTRLTDVGPRLRVHPSLDHVVGRRQRAGLGQGGVEVGEQRPRRHLVAVSSHLTVVDAPQSVHLHRWDPDEVLPLRLARPPQ